jgi:hypothetical protein
VIRGKPLRPVWVMPRKLAFFLALRFGYELPVRPGLMP